MTSPEQLPPSTAIFRYYGASAWEIETLYDTLSRSYSVEDAEVPADDPQFVTMIEIGFPAPFGEPFFQEFTMESWFKVKGVLKDMKKRRGRKGVKTYIRFSGFEGESSSGGRKISTPAATNTNTVVVFPLLSKGDRQYEMGVEKLEYLIDIVPLQLKTLPKDAGEVWYSYEEATFKWSPWTAMMANGINYFYKNNEWVQPSSSSSSAATAAAEKKPSQV